MCHWHDGAEIDAKRHGRGAAMSVEEVLRIRLGDEIEGISLQDLCRDAEGKPRPGHVRAYQRHCDHDTETWQQAEVVFRRTGVRSLLPKAIKRMGKVLDDGQDGPAVTVGVRVLDLSDKHDFTFDPAEARREEAARMEAREKLRRAGLLDMVEEALADDGDG